MSKIQGSGQVGGVCKPDMTPPPQLQLRTAVCFDRAADGAAIISSGADIRPTNRDPAYLEFGNVEVGTKLQLLNLSAHPDADWGDKKQIVELEFTGRDVQNRIGSVYLSNEQMQQLGLKPGDMLQARAIDGNNNTSVPTTIEVEPNDWAGSRVRETVDGRAIDSRGGQISALDGENQRKNLIIKAVNDGRPPQIVEDKIELRLDDRFDDDDKKLANTFRRHWAHVKTTLGHDHFTLDELKTIMNNQDLPEELRVAARTIGADKETFAAFDVAAQNDPTKADGIVGLVDIDTVRGFQRSVTLVGDMALEPRATVRVQNQRSGEVFTASIGDDRLLRLNLKDVQQGDPLLVTPTDNEGIVGQTLELVFSTCYDKGKAPTLKGGISTRLPGVIP